MAEQLMDTTNLPPGWGCKYDHNTRRYYLFPNRGSNAGQEEQPELSRARFKQLHEAAAAAQQYPPVEIPMQPMHGSPYHVYPAKNYPQAQPAFQGPPSGVLSVSASPQLAARLQQMEMSPITRPHTPKSLKQFGSQNIMQETSFSSTNNVIVTAQDTDIAVAKINTMFPTVTDTHIRLLLKKYYNREAVVISALQVEKHPLTTPGPYATPPPPRHMYSSTGLHMTPPMGRDTISSRTDSPIPRPSSCASGSYYGSPRVGEGFRSSPKPHSSPKMKLRYLKGIFPRAEETLILDLLANADNNIQKASDQLIQLGYDKKDTSLQKQSQKKKEKEEKARKAELENQPPPPLKIKTVEEKTQLKLRLQNQYKNVAERIISMALESVDYCEEKACQILTIVMQEDNEQKKMEQKADNSVEGSSDGVQQSRASSRRSSKHPTHSSGAPSQNATAQVVTMDTYSPDEKTVTIISPTSGSRFKQNRPKAKNDHAKYPIFRASPTADTTDGNVDFKTIVSKPMVLGANSELCMGPNDDLLLVDYVAWRGANTEIVLGRKGLACGPDSKARIDRNYIPRGANAELRSGNGLSLAKGSIYSQMKREMADVKVN